MTAKEKSTIKEKRLRVVSAREGESLARLSQRTNNVWPVKATAVINGIDKDNPLKEGQMIKIAVSQPF